MRQLRFTPAADQDLIQIFDYIADVSANNETARRFTAEIEAQCLKLARLPGTLGRARPELGRTIRSAPFKGYVIFFCYLEDSLEIIHVIEGHRDIGAVFNGN